MADNIEVDVKVVKWAAERIQTINKTIRDDFQDVESAIRKLNSNWNSPASGPVINHFSTIRNAFVDNRYTVMDNYSKFMLSQVSAGYTDAESKNTKLADAFK
ncbi:hypothetical protein D1B31_03870 [Neobacillus notoginsengisoli]|uniref:WXG100 family type VII secretion target n=1 Tax=Neobacillus notoginsengisoli TaxID=1578198 RepID=A0A417YY76_9BACI|nr:hypothetical protein [Neobacillus notoginsengisoli]RHW42732.1 hypothetical protein D1B31_03870 [Neobacillus notoginsengisoli]